MKRLVLVFGAGGQLGRAIVDGMARHHEVVAKTHQDVDINDADAARSTIKSVYPDIVINCAAFTNVEDAEDHPTDSLDANAWAVRSMADAAAEIDATLVHYSTDFVFDGLATTPYSEGDAPNPRSVYAMSKLLGEWFAAGAPRHYVLRVESLFGGEKRTSSVDRLLQGIVSGTEVRAFTDRVVSPSFVDDVVRATYELVEYERPFGLYHCVNTGHATWYDVARTLASLAGRPEATITPVEMAASGLRAPRPKFAALSNQKLLSTGITMASWQEALSRYVKSVLATRNDLQLHTESA